MEMTEVATWRRETTLIHNRDGSIRAAETFLVTAVIERHEVADAPGGFTIVEREISRTPVPVERQDFAALMDEGVDAATDAAQKAGIIAEFEKALAAANDKLAALRDSLDGKASALAELADSFSAEQSARAQAENEIECLRRDWKHLVDTILSVVADESAETLAAVHDKMPWLKPDHVEAATG